MHAQRRASSHLVCHMLEGAAVSATLQMQGITSVAQQYTSRKRKARSSFALCTESEAIHTAS